MTRDGCMGGLFHVLGLDRQCGFRRFPDQFESDVEIEMLEFLKADTAFAHVRFAQPVFIILGEVALVFVTSTDIE